MNLSQKQQDYWNKFLTYYKFDLDTPCKECFSFGYSKELIEELTSLVLNGQKTATASSVLAYKNEEDQPKVGDYSMIINFENEPVAIMKTTHIKIIPFDEVPWEFAKLEGEDENLESWQSNHRKFFNEEAMILNYNFSEKMPIIMEKFELVFVDN